MGQFLTKIRNISELLVSLEKERDRNKGKIRVGTNTLKRNSKKIINYSDKNLSVEN